MNIIYFGIPALLITVTAFLAVWAVKKGMGKKLAMTLQICTAMVAMGACVCFSINKEAHAASNAESEQTAVSQTVAQTKESSGDKYAASGWGLIAAALVTGLACLGGGIAVASAAPAAIAAMSEDPKTFGKSIVFVVLGEAFALYGIFISFMILGKIDQILG